MDIKQIYREETELDVYTTVSLDDGASFSNEYVKWLEEQLSIPIVIGRSEQLKAEQESYNAGYNEGANEAATEILSR